MRIIPRIPLHWLLVVLAAGALAGCTAGAGGGSAYERRQTGKHYQRDLDNYRSNPMPQSPGLTPLAGWQISNRESGVRPFVNSGALLAIPPTR